MNRLPESTPDELLGVALLLILFALLILSGEIGARRGWLSPESSRKWVHLGGGLGCLLFPLWLDSAWTVLGLALCFGGVFEWAERTQRLQSLCRVSRRSRGSVYYPFAIAALFALTSDRYDIYSAAVLVLTVADTGAALVGSRFGRIHFRTGAVDDHKSVEGSLIFWLITFTVVWFPLYWGDAADAKQAAWAAVLTATLLTTVEAVASGGRDNLYIPLLAAFMLMKVATKSSHELAMQTISMIVIFGLLIALNRYSRVLRSKALMIMGVFVYGVWSLGSADWAVPLLTAFAGFAIVFGRTGRDQRPTRAYRRLAVLTAPAAALVLVANLTGEFRWLYGPFIVAVQTPLLWGVVLQSAGTGAPTGWSWSARQWGWSFVMLAATLAYPVATGRTPDPGTLAAVSAIAIGVAWGGIGLACCLQRAPGGAIAFLAVWLAVALVVAGQLTGWLHIWEPLRWADVYVREPDVLWPLR